MWQPIETAPKDGRTACDVWVALRHPTLKPPGHRRTDCVCTRDGKWVSPLGDLIEWTDGKVTTVVTHWMPLPPPPDTPK